MAQYNLYMAGTGRQTCTAAATAPIALSATSVPCAAIEITPISTNTAPVLICNSTAEYTLASRVGFAIYATTGSHLIWCRDLSQVYMDGISTEGITYTYYTTSIP